MSTRGILQFFTKATPEEAEEQQKQRWETLRDGLRQETVISRVKNEQKAISRAERMREKSRHRSKAYRDRCRTQLEAAGEVIPRRKQVFRVSQYLPIETIKWLHFRDTRLLALSISAISLFALLS